MVGSRGLAVRLNEAAALEGQVGLKGSTLRTLCETLIKQITSLNLSFLTCKMGIIPARVRVD